MVEGRELQHGADCDPLLSEFLGSDAGLGGPFALLGLGYDIRDEAQIHLAVRRRLSQVDRHPRHLTPEADEVRLAVHAAGAQLRDRALRDALAAHWPEGQSMPIPKAWRRRMGAVSPKLARQAAMIVGSSGGWNARAKKRLAFVARTHRVNAMELVRAVRPRRVGLAWAGERASTQGRAAIAWIREPTTHGRAWLLLHGVLLTMLLLFAVLIGIELSRDPGVERASTVDTGGVMSSEQQSRGTIPEPRARIQHHAAIEQELRNTGLVATERPAAAVTRAQRVIESFISGWSRAPSDARDRIDALLGDVAVTVTQASESIDPWLELLSEAVAGDDPARAAGAGALVASLRANDRVSVEAIERLRAIPIYGEPVMGESMDRRLVNEFGGMIAGGIGRGPAWWSAWSAAIGTCASVPERDRDEVILAALGRFLEQSQRQENQIRDVVKSLAASVSWRAGSAARQWLIGSVTDPRISARRVTTLTGVLATEVSVPGVDVTMVLRSGAMDSDREQLAAAYRSAWLALRQGSSALQEEITAGLRSALSQADGAARFRDQFAAVEALSRLNAAASLEFESDGVAAGEMLQDPVGAAPSRTARSTDTLGEDWAERLLRAEGEEAVTQALLEARGSAMGEAAAEALVETAFRGPGRLVRERARGMIVARRRSAAVLLALEREVGDRPKAAVVEVVNQVLNADFDTGQIDTVLSVGLRAALLASAAEHAGGVPAEVEFSELGLRDTLARRSGLGSSVSTLEALAAIIERWRVRSSGAGAERWGGDAVMRRLAAMTAVSTSRGQVDTAYHRAIVELMAGSLIERAGLPPREVGRVMDSFEHEWSNARSAMGQMLASQRAEARLWLALLEGSL